MKIKTAFNWLLTMMTMFIMTGCHSVDDCSICSTAPAKVAPAAKKAAPAPVAKKAAPAPVANPANWEDAVHTELFYLLKTAPEKVTIGEEFDYTIKLKARQKSMNVVVRDFLPAGAKFISATPSATRNGDVLSWDFGRLNAGDIKEIKVRVKALREGALGNCATADAQPLICATTFVGRATLSIDKSGPATALLGSMVNYKIRVTNSGNALAKNVIVTDNIPNGLSHSTGKKTLTFNAGNLKPGESKDFTIALKATKRGKFCNEAIAKGSNVKAVDDEACTLVVKPGLSVVKTGTKTQYVGKRASYDIIVTNTGDTDLKNVVVTDILPVGTKLISASGNGTHANGKISWNIPTLKSGSKATYKVTLTSPKIGTLCNNVSVKDASGLSSADRACTDWKGHPALLLELVDTVDPLLPGEETTYIVKVTNQGTANDQNVSFTAAFPAGIKPLSITGSTAGRIVGQNVSVSAFATLKPGASIEWRIKAKAISIGDNRVKLKMKSNLHKNNPVNEEESTQVY